MKHSEIDRKLEFRVTPSGIERLQENEEKPGTLEVKAVQPVLNLADANKLWLLMLDLNLAAEYSKRDKDAWSAKAFEEHEALQQANLDKGSLENLNSLLQEKQRELEAQLEGANARIAVLSDKDANRGVPVVLHESFDDAEDEWDDEEDEKSPFGVDAHEVKNPFA